MIYIECEKCKAKSPPMPNTQTMPSGWTVVNTRKGAATETTFRCPEHP